MERIISSYIIDLLFGDPQWFPHPVRGIGKIISFFDRRLRGKKAKWIERTKGVVLFILVTVFSCLSVYFFIETAGKISPFLAKTAWIFSAYLTLATRDLIGHSEKIFLELKRNDIKEARKKLGLIVGRDTQDLSKKQIITATIESLAENTNDGITAPLFYLFIGGPVFAFFYKAVNTLDSMVGHKDEKYIHFGWFSARMDDILNFIPARITGVLIVMAAFMLSKDGKNAARIMLKDGNKHPSCNSGISEAAMAGALGIRLGGICSYEGIECRHPYIGEDKNPLDILLIKQCVALCFLVSFLAVSLGVILRWII